MLSSFEAISQLPTNHCKSLVLSHVSTAQTLCTPDHQQLRFSFESAILLLIFRSLFESGQPRKSQFFIEGDRITLALAHPQQHRFVGILYHPQAHQLRGDSLPPMSRGHVQIRQISTVRSRNPLNCCAGID